MERLPAMIVIRACVAVTLLVGFYVVGLGSVVVLAGLSVWLWWAVPGQVAHDMSYAVIAVALGLVVPVWRILRARPTPPPGAVVSPEQAPELWALVRELAAAAGTRPPDEIRLFAEANAGVWEDAGLVGLRSGRRYLYLGAPLLESLTVSQFRAVLAHEFGHYARGHTRLGALTYRGMRGIAQTLDRLRRHPVAGALMTGYALLYALVALAVMRQMEVEADRAGVRVAGRDAMAQALTEVPRLGTAWEAYLDSCVGWVDGYSAGELLAYFGALVEWRSPELDRVPARVAATKPSRWDSHPPIEERLALVKLELDGEPDGLLDTLPVRVLVDSFELRSAGLRTVDFDEHLAAVAQEQALQASRPLYHAAARLALENRERGDFGTVLDVLAAGRAEALGAELRRSVTGAGPLAERVLAAVNATLVISAGAGWRHAWSAPMTLVSAKGGDIAARPLVDDACRDPAAVRRLREFMHALGVPGVVTTDSTDWRYEPLDSSFDGLLLPDIVLILAETGRGRIQPDVLAAGLAAAALAELRLRDRVEVTDTREATLQATDTTPTGDRFLDSVLNRVAQAGPDPAYRWLQRLGPAVTQAVRRRVDRWFGDDENVRSTARADIVEALRTGDLDGRAVTLGALLWGTELSGSVLGWRSGWSRFWLGRVASRDRLAIAIRTVIGVNIRVSYGGGNS